MPATLSTFRTEHHTLPRPLRRAGGWGRRGRVGATATRSLQAATDVSRPDGAQTSGAAHACRVVAGPCPTPPPPPAGPRPWDPLARSLGEIERESFELDREVDVLEPDVAGNLDAGGREVQDGFDAGRDQLIRDRLRGLYGHRDDRDLDAPSLHLAAEIAAREDRGRLDLGRDLRRIHVEDGRDAEPLAGEAPVVEQGRAEIAEADECHRPLAIEAEDPLELGLEPRDVVADAANAELAEVGEVLSDLRRVEIEPVRQLLRGHGLDAVLLELQQASGVDRETTDRHLGDLRQAGVRTWRHRTARRAREACGAPVLHYALVVTRN